VTRATVSFLGGVNEIGGNKVLIEDGPDRILFDFGPSFSPQFEEFYVDFLQPRSTSEVKDLLEFDLIPRVEGLYSRAALQGSDLDHQPPSIHAIFVSHAHADHSGYLHLVDPDIPVFVGATTRSVLDAIETSGTRKYGEHSWRIVGDSQPVKVGNIEVIPFPVDHSIPGAYGYLVRTSQGTVVYTGDFRQHGPRAADTHRFLGAASAEEPEALVIEGTRAGPEVRQSLSEEGVRTGVDQLLGSTSDLALVCTYPRDVDRLMTLYRAATAIDRTLVVSLKTAHLLTTIGQRFPDLHLPIPGSSPGIVAYGRKKRRYYAWEVPLLDGCIEADELRSRGSQYLFAIDLMHFAELIDIRPPAGSPFIHSMSEPFSEDDVDDRVFHRWLDHFGLAFHQMHASGHCSALELQEIVGSVSAKTVYPIHTVHPEAIRGGRGKAVPPEKGKPYPLGE